MRDIQGILFTEASYTLVTDLIGRMKTHGDFDECAHPRMSHGRGELWLAHRGAKPPYKVALGVFARFIPSDDGVKFTHKRNGADGVRRIMITNANTNAVLTSMVTRYEETKAKVKRTEKADPDKPWTVSGGQFESKRRKH